MKNQLKVAACLVAFTSPYAFAGDDINSVQVPKCGFFCKIGRHLSLRADLPEAYTRLDAYEPVSESTFEEEARTPNVRHLVAVPGEIIRRSPAERARERKQAAVLEERIDALRSGTDLLLPHSITANTTSVPSSKKND